MGHAGAFLGAGERSAKGKVKVLEDSGVTIVNHPSKFGEAMKQLLSSQVSNISLDRPEIQLLIQFLRRRALETPPKNAVYIHCEGLLCPEVLQNMLIFGTFTLRNLRAIKC